MRYREVIRMPIWLLTLIYLFLLSLVLSIWAALGNNAAITSLIICTGLLIVIAIKSAMVIEVDERELRVGRARIALKFLGASHALSGQQVRLLRTRDADPAAFLGIRFWSSTGVRIEINDVRDQTPYWLITSNHAHRFVKSLEKN